MRAVHKICTLVENSQHSDFTKLRRMLIQTHMQDLKDTTQDVHYENFRAQCISQISHQALRSKKRESISSNDTVSETDRLLLQKDEEVCGCSLCCCIVVFIFSIEIPFPIRFY